MLLEEQQAVRESLTSVLNAQGERYQLIHLFGSVTALIMQQ
jgi:hypothetical protein